MNAWQTIAESSMQPALQQLVQRIGWTLVHSIWQGLAIAATLTIALRFLRDAAATKRYAACCLAMVLTIGAGAATFYWCGEITQPPAPVAKTIQLPATNDSVITAVSPSASAKLSPIDRQRAILQSIVALWAIGVVVMAVRHVGGWLWLLRLRQGEPLLRYQPAMEQLTRRLGVRRIVRLIETSRIDVPAVIGFVRPVILIPIGILNELTAQQVEAILAHELAHVRRNDYLVNLLQAVVETLMFYHPAVWWMSNRMRAEREHCCDDIAAATCGDKRLYASALTALEYRRSTAPSAAIAATGGQLLSRVRRLLKLPPPARVGSARSIAIGVIALLCVGISLICFVAFGSRHDRIINLAAHGGASSEYRYVNVLVGEQSMLFEGKLVDWKQLEAMLAAIPEADRKKTVIAVAANAPEVTVERYFDTSNRLSELVKKYGLAYVSQTGIKQASARSNDLPPGTESGEYYMDGHVRRSGVYSLTGRKISVRQALIAAGGVDAGFEKSQVQVIRRNGDLESQLAQNLSVDDLLNGRAEDIFLKPNDVIRVGATPTSRAATQQAILGPPPDPAQPGEYYIDGEVPRTGVYNMTARKITLKQAIAAAGGLQENAKLFVITVIRRIGKDQQEKPLDHLPADDLMQGRHADIYLWPNDIIYITKKNPPATTQGASAMSIEAGPVASAGEYFMDGYVTNPGVRRIGPAGITLRQAMAAAGGLEKGENDAKVYVLRDDEHGKYGAAVKGKWSELSATQDADLPLRPDDLIRVFSLRTGQLWDDDPEHERAVPEVPLPALCDLTDTWMLLKKQPPRDPIAAAASRAICERMIRKQAALFSESGASIDVDALAEQVSQIVQTDPILRGYITARKSLGEYQRRLREKNTMGSESRILHEAGVATMLNSEQIQKYLLNYLKQHPAATKQ